MFAIRSLQCRYVHSLITAAEFPVPVSMGKLTVSLPAQIQPAVCVLVMDKS